MKYGSILAFALFIVTAGANAAIFNVIGVERGDNGNKFVYSGLHTIPDTSRPMNGDALASFDLFTGGIYDSGTGKLAVGLSWEAQIGSRSGLAVLYGAPLLFGADGYLASDAQLSLNYIDGIDLSSLSRTATFDFAAGRVCCGTIDDGAPNSLQQGDDGYYYINLWGWSQNFPEPGFRNVGIDIRLQLERAPEVPLPAAAWFFGSAFAGLIGWRRRQAG